MRDILDSLLIEGQSVPDATEGKTGKALEDAKKLRFTPKPNKASMWKDLEGSTKVFLASQIHLLDNLNVFQKKKKKERKKKNYF